MLKLKGRRLFQMWMGMKIEVGEAGDAIHKIDLGNVGSYGGSCAVVIRTTDEVPELAYVAPR